LNSTSRLDQSELLNEQVHANELQELLARLAATDALFSEAVPTIRDVAEATDASPLLIGRILSELRGNTFADSLHREMEDFRVRLSRVEKTISNQAGSEQFGVNAGDFDYDGSYRRLLEAEKLDLPSGESAGPGFILAILCIIFATVLFLVIARERGHW
jgi:hypothetical protein